MADQTQFKHIKVNAACDDVVIYAGSHDPMQAVEESVAIPAAGSAQEQYRQPEEPEISEAWKSQDGFQSTTIQDIATSKMPTIQKVIIAIAAAAVAAFIIWYLFFQ